MKETAAETENGNGKSRIALSYVHEVQVKNGRPQKYASPPSFVDGKDLSKVVTDHLFGVPKCVEPGEILCNTGVTVEVAPGGRVAKALISAVKQGTNGGSTTLELHIPGKDPKITILAHAGGDGENGEGPERTLILRDPEVGKQKVGINPDTMLAW